MFTSLQGIVNISFDVYRVNPRTVEDIAAEAQVEALPEVDEEWDPFDEDD